MTKQLCEALREFTTGLLNQLLVNLTGQDGPEWLKEFKKFLRKEPCWVKEGGCARTFGKLETIQVVPDGEVLGGDAFVAKAKADAQKLGKKPLGDEAFNFYKQKKNHHLLPDADSGINVVVFTEATFDSGGLRGVRVLMRGGVGWLESSRWLGSDFGSGDRAGVS